MLLACQRVRERRRRINVLKAERACASVAAEEASAHERRDAQVALCAIELTAAYEAVSSRVIALHELKRLMAVEETLQQQIRSAESALVEAEDNRRNAESALADAKSLLGKEVRLTRRRERLADKMEAAWRHATETAAEADVEDQVADSWHAI
jgi:hypothetical protein